MTTNNRNSNPDKTTDKPVQPELSGNMPEIPKAGGPVNQAVARPNNPAPEAHMSNVGLKPGWGAPKPEHIPAPTYWPVLMAVAITFLAFGVVTSLFISGVGVILFFISLAGWIGDIRNEQREHHKH